MARYYSYSWMKVNDGVPLRSDVHGRYRQNLLQKIGMSKRLKKGQEMCHELKKQYSTL